MTHPVQAAVAPLKAEAIAYGKKQAYEAADRFLAAIAEFDNCMSDFNPYPRGGSKADYNKYSARQGLRSQLMVADDERNAVTYNRDNKYYSKPCPALREVFAEKIGEVYGENYDKFVAKLIGKVGLDVTTADLDGNHIWGHSILTITRSDGSVENWKTQTILNFSVHGTPFNQWPTRKTK